MSPSAIYAALDRVSRAERRLPRQLSLSAPPTTGPSPADFTTGLSPHEGTTGFSSADGTGGWSAGFTTLVTTIRLLLSTAKATHLALPSG